MMVAMAATAMVEADCIFCKIATRELPSTPVHEDQEFMAFPDLHPKAPVHILLIPKQHVLRSIADMTANQQAMLGRLLDVAHQIAEQQGIADDGYRLVFNVRHHGGQEVDHLHLHILGGQPLGPLG